MSFSTTSTWSLYLLSFNFLFKAAFGDNLLPLKHISSSPENFTAGDPFDTNQQELTSYLSYETPHNGYSHGSRGQSPDQVFGLALCAVDVLHGDCWSCLFNAAREIRNRCPNSKGATMWYD
ncbi:hypothetical protein FH972_020733 [Carpinus fangiana]|uniref:Gnk2-homologous domain-containing protein n=1 Tax=Carpinus fangiana TaxID=176857 RepID=A0A5N6RYJ5_9ROSI|nr:hypothetical protein FH972_020733 [Carpinus fangiana]